MVTKSQRKSYSFTKYKAEAAKDRTPTEPFVIDDVEPPIEIQPPTTLEQQVELNELIGPDGEFEMRNVRKILAAFCGPAFPRLWELLRKEHADVFAAVANDMIAHFKEDLDTEAANAPGGSPASSN